MSTSSNLKLALELATKAKSWYWMRKLLHRPVMGARTEERPAVFYQLRIRHYAALFEAAFSVRAVNFSKASKMKCKPIYLAPES